MSATPMRRRVPSHMHHLRRDRRGLPVPTVNRWGSDDASRTRLAADLMLNALGGPTLGVYLDDDFEPTPDFTAQSPQRQRRSVAQGRCQVCDRPLRWRDRRLVLSLDSLRYVRLHGGSVLGLTGEVPVVTEPWLCPPCSDFARNICPALIRRERSEQLVEVVVDRPSQVLQVATLATLDGHATGPGSVEEPAVLWISLALVDPSLSRRITRA